MSEFTADYSTGFAELRGDIGKLAAKSEAETNKISADMAKRDSWLMAAILGAAAFVTTVLGIVIHWPFGG